jgi:hypothetical protein
VQQVLGHRQTKGGGLARAGLRQTDYVQALESPRNDLGLDGRGVLEADRRQ